MDQSPNLITGSGQTKPSAFWRSRWFAYGFAIAMTGFTLLVRLWLAPWIGGNRPLLVLFFIPILVSAYVGGLGPGLVATAITAVTADYFLIPHTHSFSFASPMDFLQWLILVASGILASVLNDALHRARLRADANRRLLAVTLSSIGDAVITTDAQGCVTFLNREAERLTGWTNAEAAGQPMPTVFRIVNEETRATVEDPVQKVIRSGLIVGLANHTVLIARDGREFIIDDSGAPIRGADGAIIGVVLVFRDNTEQKRAEDALRRNERFLQQTGHIAKVGGWEFDPVTGAGHWGEEVARIHDLPPETKPNKEMGFSFYHGESRAKIEAAVKRAIENGTPYDLELEINSAKGVRKWVRTICEPVVENGKVVSVCGVLQDITDQKRMQSALDENHALYHSLVDQMPAGIFRKDAAGRYVFVNATFCQLKGMTPEQFLGKTALELGLEDTALADAGSSHHAQILATGARIEVEEKYLRADGQTAFFHVVKTPVYNSEGKIAGSQGILFDITQRKQVEASLRQSQEQLSGVIRQAQCIVFSGEVEGRADWREHALEPVSPFRWNFNVLNETIAQSILPLDLAPGQTYQQAWSRSRHPDDHCKMNQASGQAFLTGAPFYRNEFRCTDRKGNVHWMQQHVTVRKISENRWQVFGITTDVTGLKTLEERYRDQHALLRTLIDLVPDYIFVKDTEGRYLVVNEALAKCYGRFPAEMLNRSDADFLPPELATRFRAGEQQVLTTQTFRSFEDTLTFPDGQPRVLVTNMVAFRNPQGELAGIVGIGRDITAQKAAGQAMRENEARLSTIFHASPVGIVITQISDGQILEANEAFANIHGYTPHEIIGRTTLELGLWENREQREQMIHTLNTKGRVKNLEIKFRRKDGTFGFLLLAVEIIQLAGKTCALGMEIDITKRKQAEAQMLQLATIVESSEDAIIGKTLEGVITSWNRGAEEIFGYLAGEAIGQSMLMLFPAERKNEEAEILARISRGESVDHFETERIRKDGAVIRISATISPLRNSQGTIVGVSNIARDITRQHLLEEQLRQSQKMEAIGQLAGGVAHDFNNILAVIQMQTELAKIEGEFSAEQAACLDEIQVAANRAANLTRQLLLFSRRQRLQPRDLDLSDSITGMTRMLRRLLGEDIQMQFKYAPQPLFIHADAGMMDQLLMNLTVNSRDAMPNGGQLIIETAAVEFDELAASQSAQARPGSFIRLSVSDTGTGIAPEILPRIFEPFFTTKDVGKGTGLGLAIVFSIVQQHQGWINVYSERGRGTTFHIYLPRLNQPSEHQPPTQSALTSASGGAETIMLVEDDEALRASILKALTQLGYRVLEAGSGMDALKVWEKHRHEINLLLTDLVMPGGMNGKELGQRLLRENPKLKIIYSSGYSAEVAGKDFPLVEGVNFLPKPFPAQMLAQTIRACLDAI